MKKQTILKQNKGFSLVEVVVAVLISTMVVLSVVLFLSVAMNQYQSSGSEVNLQIESQIVTNLISDIVIESKEKVECNSFSHGGSNYKVMNILAFGEKKDGSGNTMYNNIFVLDVQNSRLLYKKYEYSLRMTGEELKSYVISNVIAESELKKVFLADYVTDMEISISNHLAKLTVSFYNSGKTYVAESSIYLRNSLPVTTAAPTAAPEVSLTPTPEAVPET